MTGLIDVQKTGSFSFRSGCQLALWLRDAAQYIIKLPKEERDADERQAAMG
jgi:hypothetical protein